MLKRLYAHKPKLLSVNKADMLCKMLQHAKSSIPYYQQHVKKLNMPKNGIEAIDQLDQWPFLDKDIIRREGTSLLSKDCDTRGTYWNTSGGSTGAPVRIKQDKFYLACSRYITFQQKMSTGFKLGDPWLKIWGDEREILHGKRALRQQVLDKIKNLQMLNSFCMTEVDKRNILIKIEKTSPSLIVAYVQSIYELAKFARENDFGGFNIGGVIVSAGTLYPFMKKEIQDVFQVPVFNRYGSREVGNISISIPGESVMAISKGCWIEVVDENGKRSPLGVEGEIVVTSLINYSMPLIRYRIGDRGIIGERDFTAGETSLVLENVTGRSVDLFRTISGAHVDGEYFTHLMYHREWLSRFQVEQLGLEHILVKLCTETAPKSCEIEDIENKIKLVMGDNCVVEFEFLSSLPDPPSGKFRYTLSNIK